MLFDGRTRTIETIRSYGENMLRGHVLSVSTCTENECISDRPSWYLYRVGLYWANWSNAKLQFWLGRIRSLQSTLSARLLLFGTSVLHARQIVVRVMSKLLRNVLAIACTHDNPANREFESIWIFCKLRKAIKKSYLVTSKIWQYKVA